MLDQAMFIEFDVFVDCYAVVNTSILEGSNNYTLILEILKAYYKIRYNKADNAIEKIQAILID